MDTLHSLVKFRSNLITCLENLSAEDSINSAVDQLGQVMSKNPEIVNFTTHDKLIQSITRYKDILPTLKNIEEYNHTIIQDIEERIDTTADQIELNFIDELSFQVFQLDLSISQLILDSIQKYADWSYPGLRLGCRYVGQNTVNEHREKDNNLSILFSNHMVAFDPLYFCDVNDTLISQTTEHFNDLYKNRIRKYVTGDLSILPENQFGFVFCWWVLNFYDISSLETYLKNVYNLLRPGGTFMFSYNNSDILESARLVDMNFMSHVPYRHLVKICSNIGFEIIRNYDIVNSDSLIQIISWVEIKKPGILSTIKLQQVLGKIQSNN
jgi:hypothetical protein